MIIDFHTHAFPDALAEKALHTLVSNLNGKLTPVHNGTVSGILDTMEQWKVDISVIVPVATKSSQTKTLNEWAKSICSDRLIAFGSIFPHTDRWKEDIDFIVSLGLKGIKLHPEYQDFTVDDPRMLQIYDYALSKNLILIFHAGEDGGMLPPYKSNPKQFARIVDELRGGVIVAAHLGSHRMWSDVEKYLAGKNIYLDTSMGFDFYSNEQFLRIVKAHGADKILFASDSPWSSAGKELETIRLLPLAEDEKCAITGENARRLLSLN